MAITKIWGIKKTLNKAIEYIINEKKTDGKLLITSNDCFPEMAEFEMKLTREYWGKNSGNLAFHLVQSFMANELDANAAHDIGMELAKKLNLEKHQFILSTHIDKDNIHNHIIFNSVSSLDGKRYYDNKKSYKQIQKINDTICEEKGLSVIESSDKKKINKKIKPLNYDNKKPPTYKELIKQDIDFIIKKSKSYDEFIDSIKTEKGYEIKQGKYTSFRPPGKEKFVRDKTLGEDFTKENIKKKISINNLGYDFKSPYENKTKTSDMSWRTIIRQDIYNTIAKCNSYEELIKLLKTEKGYEIKEGKYTSFRPQDKERFVRDKTLGDDFTKENISKIIELKNYGIKFGIYKEPTFRSKNNKVVTYKKNKKITLFQKIKNKFIILSMIVKKDRAKLEHRSVNNLKRLPQDYNSNLSQLSEVSKDLLLLNKFNIKSPKDLEKKVFQLKADIDNLQRNNIEVKKQSEEMSYKYNLLIKGKELMQDKHYIEELKINNLDTNDKKIHFLKEYRKIAKLYNTNNNKIDNLSTKLQDINNIKYKYIGKDKKLSIQNEKITEKTSR